MVKPLQTRWATRTKRINLKTKVTKTHHIHFYTIAAMNMAMGSETCTNTDEHTELD